MQGIWLFIYPVWICHWESVIGISDSWDEVAWGFIAMDSVASDLIAIGLSARGLIYRDLIVKGSNAYCLVTRSLTAGV
jgi:hypothetical protein